MASDYNKFGIIGRLTRDPELKSTNSGSYLCRFSLASNRSRPDGQGGYVDKPGFYDVVVWGKQAETAAKYLQRGHRVLVFGHLDWQSWEGNDGKKQSKVVLEAEGYQFLEPRNRSGGGNEEPPPSGAGAYDHGGAVSDDDIPF